ncbi:MAG: hypothetical protein K5912_00240, partial [Alphaproteobacteria bacterium]|nr:hypothetical protein [Alphaproteobacteria bacterium]
KDKVLVSALRAAYMDVMHAREFPLCVLYLTLPPQNVDVNVSPTKNDVHFLEPTHVRSFIIKTLRDVLGQTMVNVVPGRAPSYPVYRPVDINLHTPTNPGACVCQPFGKTESGLFGNAVSGDFNSPKVETSNVPDTDTDIFELHPLGRVIGQIANKYILATTGDNLVVVDQHAAHERITYERLRNHTIKVQPLLTPIVVRLRPEDVNAVLTIIEDLRDSGLVLDSFGDDAIAIFEKNADWDMDWASLLHDIADEVRENGHSSQLKERLHLKLANYACHHSVRAGQKLDYEQMDALLREIEKTEHGAECNHGRPVYKFIPISQIDGWFERI